MHHLLLLGVKTLPCALKTNEVSRSWLQWALDDVYNAIRKVQYMAVNVSLFSLRSSNWLLELLFWSQHARKWVSE